MVTWEAKWRLRSLTAVLLSASIYTPILGRVGDIAGKERMLVLTLVVLAVGSIIAGMAHSIAVLIIARAVQGFGGAVLPLSFGIVRDEFPGVKVAGAVGIIAAMAAVGGGAGIVLAGPIVTHLNCHWLFWIPMIIAAAVMSSIVASEILGNGYPAESDYTKGFCFLAIMTMVAVVAALFIPKAPAIGADPDLRHHLEHAELAMVPGGSIAEY